MKSIDLTHSPALAELAAELPDLPPGAICCVGFSAGADSTALLLASCLRHGASRTLALHVNHQLQPASEDFELQAQMVATQLACSFLCLRVDARAAPRQSPEAAARDARYIALADACLDQPVGSHCLLAHHASDQAETLILAISRGQGPQGLSGMGRTFIRHGAPFSRPFIEREPGELRHALAECGASWTEDPTNADPRFSRNLVRAQAMPALQRCFPHFSRAAARSMAHLAQAQEILDDMARMDLAANPGMLLKPFAALSSARQANLLRHWLVSIHGAYPTQAQIEEALPQILAASTRRDRRIDIKLGHGRLVRSSDQLNFDTAPGPTPKSSRAKP